MTDHNDVPGFIADTPASTSLVTTRQEAKALARSLFGDLPANKMRFICISCGWDKTLEFDEGEIAALGGDISEYSGPCGKCNCQTLTPHGSILAGTNIEEAAQANFTKQIDNASDIVLDKIERRVTDFMVGGPSKKPEAPAPGAPITRDDLPDVNTVGRKP
jgi:hypothetical protein